MVILYPLFNHCICTFYFFLNFCELSFNRDFALVRLTCLINITYLLTYLRVTWYRACALLYTLPSITYLTHDRIIRTYAQNLPARIVLNENSAKFDI